jgi:hypothetical protein
MPKRRLPLTLKGMPGPREKKS